MGIENNRTQIEPDAGQDEVLPPATEGTDVAPAKDQAADGAEPAPGGDGTGEPGQEDSQAGAADGEAETQAGTEGEIDQQGGLSPAVAAALEGVHKRLDDIAKGTVGHDDPEPDLAKEVLLPEFSEPLLAKFAEEYEVTPKQANLFRGMINEVAGRILKQVQGTTAGYRRDQAIASMATDKDAAGKVRFPGINTPQVRAGMDEFLKDYSPGIHARKDTLERAFWYARGKMRDVDMTKLRKGKEVSRTIAGKTKLAPAGGGAPGEKSIVLNSSQKLAAKWHPQGEKGYIEDLKRGGGARRARIEAAV